MISGCALRVPYRLRRHGRSGMRLEGTGGPTRLCYSVTCSRPGDLEASKVAVAHTQPPRAQPPGQRWRHRTTGTSPPGDRHVCHTAGSIEHRHTGHPAVAEAAVAAVGAPRQERGAYGWQALAELRGESAEVGERGGAEERVAGERAVLGVEGVGGGAPARALATQAANELLCAVQLHRAQLHLLFQLVLFVCTRNTRVGNASSEVHT